ncbi:hypothetical protein [Sorangium sp. So ce117]|uniref:hypothetical protein n=1 Tax=Sorangium sp. So ce117 TaxID=3133277 RepID=UPI003F624E59
MVLGFGSETLAVELVCGEPPFGRSRSIHQMMTAHQFDPPPAFTPHATLPGGFEPWVRKLVMKDPEHRFHCLQMTQ